MRNARVLRKQRGETAAAVASFTGISESALSRFETGSQMLRLPALKALAQYYGCSIDSLLLEGYEMGKERKPLRVADGRAPTYEAKGPGIEPEGIDLDGLLQLRGLGKEIWDEHPDEYVKRLREGWD